MTRRLTPRRARRARRSSWWAELLGLGRVFGVGRVTRYQGRVYGVGPRRAYRRKG